MSSKTVLLPIMVDPLFVQQIAKTLSVQVIIKQGDQIKLTDGTPCFPVKVEGDKKNIKAFEHIATTNLSSFSDYLRWKAIGASLPDIEALKAIKDVAHE